MDSKQPPPHEDLISGLEDEQLFCGKFVCVGSESILLI